MYAAGGMIAFVMRPCAEKRYIYGPHSSDSQKPPSEASASPLLSGNVPAAGTGASETVTCECGNRQDWEAEIGGRPEDVGVEIGCKGVIRTDER